MWKCRVIMLFLLLRYCVWWSSFYSAEEGKDKQLWPLCERKMYKYCFWKWVSTLTFTFINMLIVCPKLYFPGIQTQARDCYTVHAAHGAIRHQQILLSELIQRRIYLKKTWCISVNERYLMIRNMKGSCSLIKTMHGHSHCTIMYVFWLKSRAIIELNVSRHKMYPDYGCNSKDISVIRVIREDFLFYFFFKEHMTFIQLSFSGMAIYYIRFSLCAVVSAINAELQLHTHALETKKMWRVYLLEESIPYLLLWEPFVSTNKIKRWMKVPCHVLLFNHFLYISFIQVEILINQKETRKLPLFKRKAHKPK